jgi:chromosome partitioning protein
LKVISLINMKGGVGKSTMATNIANHLSDRLGQRVLLVDIDPQFNATQCVISTADYIKHMKSGGDTICDIFYSSKINLSTLSGPSTNNPKELKDIKPVQINANFHIIPGSLGLYKIEMKPGEGVENKLKKYLKIKENDYDYIIIDTPPTPSVWMSSSLIASNYYLIPAKPDPLSITGIDLLDSIISEKRENFDLDIECAGIVFNMVEGNSNLHQESRAFFSNHKRWRSKLFKAYLSKRTALARNQTQGLFINDLHDEDMKLSLSKIVDELLSRIGDDE